MKKQKPKNDKSYIILIYDELEDYSTIFKKAVFCSNSKKVFKYLKKKDYNYDKYVDLSKGPVYRHKYKSKCVIISECLIYNE